MTVGRVTSVVDQTAQQALTWHKRLVARISPRRPWTKPWSVHVEFVVGNWQWGKVSYSVIQATAVYVVHETYTYSPSTTNVINLDFYKLPT